jgi:hypothetical protein
VCIDDIVYLVAVASSEESPVAMKLKKMWLKAPVSEDGDTNLGKRSLTSYVFCSLVRFADIRVIVNLTSCMCVYIYIYIYIFIYIHIED